MRYVALCVGLFSLNSFASEGSKQISIKNQNNLDATIFYSFKGPKNNKTKAYHILKSGDTVTLSVLVESKLTVQVAGNRQLQYPITNNMKKNLIFKLATIITPVIEEISDSSSASSSYD